MQGCLCSQANTASLSGDRFQVLQHDVVLGSSEPAKWASGHAGELMAKCEQLMQPLAADQPVDNSTVSFAKCA